jgi:hypothetical protein
MTAMTQNTEAKDKINMNSSENRSALVDLPVGRPMSHSAEAISTARARDIVESELAVRDIIVASSKKIGDLPTTRAKDISTETIFQNE